MSPIVTKGYLIARYDYSLFDEILIFINNFGNKFTCLALGTRKINSKNSRALFFGNYLEIELFYSKNNRLSKLKKVTTLNEIGFEYAANLAFYTIGDIYSSLENLNKSWYSFYQDVLIKILMNYDQYKLSCYIYLVFIQKLPTNIKLINCNHFTNINSIKIGYSFSKNALVCTTCFPNINDFNKEELEIIKNIAEKNINIDNNFFSKNYNINWKTFHSKLSNSFKELKIKINQTYK